MESADFFGRKLLTDGFGVMVFSDSASLSTEAILEFE